jgi:hypothetical protein
LFEADNALLRSSIADIMQKRIKPGWQHVPIEMGIELRVEPLLGKAA